MEKEIWNKYREQGLMVFGVNAGERSDPMRMAREFVDKHGVTYPVMMDLDDVASQAYQVQAFPTVAVIDRKGVLRYLEAGFNEQGVLDQVKALLAEKP